MHQFPSFSHYSTLLLRRVKGTELLEIFNLGSLGPWRFHKLSSFLRLPDSHSKARLVPSHLTLCNLMDCSPPGSSVHGILQARYWGGWPFPSPGDLPDPGIKSISALQEDSFFFFFSTMYAEFFFVKHTHQGPVCC